MKNLNKWEELRHDSHVSSDIMDTDFKGLHINLYRELRLPQRMS